MKKEKVALGAAVLTAFAASLCCVGPLAAVALGVGALGAATAVFEPFRPYLLGASSILVGFGFYRAYFRRAYESCGPGTSCALRPAGRGQRWFLLAATAAVLAFAAVPYFAGALADRLVDSSPAPDRAAATPGGPDVTPSELSPAHAAESPTQAAVSPVAPAGGDSDRPARRTQPRGSGSEAPTSTATLSISGMTCASCASTATLALRQVPGVKSVSVDYERAEAVVRYDPAQVTTPEIVRSLGEKTPYTASLRHE